MLVCHVTGPQCTVLLTAETRHAQLLHECGDTAPFGIRIGIGSESANGNTKGTFTHYLLCFKGKSVCILRRYEIWKTNVHYKMYVLLKHEWLWHIH